MAESATELKTIFLSILDKPKTNQNQLNLRNLRTTALAQAYCVILFSELFLVASKKLFFFRGPAFTPPPLLVAGQLKKKFLRLPLLMK